MIKKISLWVGLIVGILAIGSGIFKWQDTLVKAENFNTYVQSIQCQIKGNTYLIQKTMIDSDISSIQKRIWTIEDRYLDKTIPVTVKEELRLLKVKLISKQNESAKIAIEITPKEGS